MFECNQIKRILPFIFTQTNITTSSRLLSPSAQVHVYVRFYGKTEHMNVRAQTSIMQGYSPLPFVQVKMAKKPHSFCLGSISSHVLVNPCFVLHRHIFTLLIPLQYLSIGFPLYRSNVCAQMKAFM